MDMWKFREQLGLIDRFPNECYEHLKNGYEIAARRFKKQGDIVVFRNGADAGFPPNKIDFKRILLKTLGDFDEEIVVDRFVIYLTIVLGINNDLIKI